MRATGIVRRVDILGRVVVPKEIRKVLKITEGDPLEIYTEKDEIILKKYSPVSSMGDTPEAVTVSLSKMTGHSVFVCDKDLFLSASGQMSKEVMQKALSGELDKLISERKTLVVNYLDGGNPIELTRGETYGFYNELIVPIVSGEDVLGAIVVANKSKDAPISSADIQLTTLAQEFIASHF